MRVAVAVAGVAGVGDVGGFDVEHGETVNVFDDGDAAVFAGEDDGIADDDLDDVEFGAGGYYGANCGDESEGSGYGNPSEDAQVH